MALQNIGASNQNDAFYRYKMPKMVTKTEGRGNGIKTNIVNNVDIAKALGRPASYTTKFFGIELCAQSKFDDKTGTSLVNGAHDTSKLASLLEVFIKKYVQCYGCGNPETEIVITKKEMVNLKCAACGFLSQVDVMGRFTTFIVKHPPVQKKDKKQLRKAEKERIREGKAADEEQRKMNKEAKRKGSCSKSSKIHSSYEDISPKNDGDDDGEWATDASKEAAEKRMREQLSAVTAQLVILSTEEDEKKPAKSKDLVQEMKEYLKTGLPISKLKDFISSLAYPSQDIMDALFNALFEGVGKGFEKEVVKKKSYLAAATQEDGSKMLLLKSIKSFCGKKGNELAVEEVALAVKALYDCDIVEEEVVLEWYVEGLNGVGKTSPVWKKMKPLVEWLRTAESESEEED